MTTLVWDYVQVHFAFTCRIFIANEHSHYFTHDIKIVDLQDYLREGIKLAQLAGMTWILGIVMTYTKWFIHTTEGSCLKIIRIVEERGKSLMAALNVDLLRLE